jgi:deoxyribodipyrimidine photolyase-related protein
MTEAPSGLRRYDEHQQRLALVWSAQRHFRDDLAARGLTVRYDAIEDVLDEGAAPDVPTFLRRQIEAHAPERVAVTEPGRYDLLQALEAVADAAGVPLDVYADAHFLVTHETFEAWAEGRKSLTLEYFYREQRRAYDCLLTDDGDPVGGDWNYDDQNRESFDRAGPQDVPDGPAFPPDATTQAVLDLVADRFADHPGALDGFHWPVTPDQAQAALDDFLAHRLPTFGTYQDAMWTDAPFLYHSRLSAALNLKLLDPRVVVARAEAAYRDGDAPLNAVEGFIRQILGWREFIRGIYWLHAGDWPAMNELDATADLPDVYWTADTQMTCMAQSLGQVRDHAYGHHIQRLMITGLFGLLAGVDPHALNAWHEAMYIDAWDWVSTPNMIGMSQYADGGIVGTKPYTASGKYVSRMSNYCRNCVYDPADSTSDDACPFSTLYWDFLDRHRDQLAGNRRMNFQLANVRRKSDAQMEAIRERAGDVRTLLAEGSL